MRIASIGNLWPNRPTIEWAISRSQPSPLPRYPQAVIRRNREFIRSFVPWLCWEWI